MQLQQEKQISKIKFASQMWAARSHLASIFEKLLDQKTFIYLRLIPQTFIFSIVYSIIKKAASKYIALLAAFFNHKQFSYKLSNTIVA